MSELSEAIEAFGTERLAEVLSSQAEFQVLNLTWSTADEIIPALASMGFTTLDQVLTWVRNVNAALGNPSAFVYLIDPPVPVSLAGMPTVDMPVIHQAIVDQGKTRDDFFIDQSDRTYCLPTKAEWDLLAATCPVKRRKWVAESFDCDDFSRAFLGWLAMNGLGNTAAGFCAITMYDFGGTLIGGHAVVLVMDADKKLWFLDPQTAKLYEVTYPKLGGAIFGKTVKIARAFF